MERRQTDAHEHMMGALDRSGKSNAKVVFLFVSALWAAGGGRPERSLGDRGHNCTRADPRNPSQGTVHGPARSQLECPPGSGKEVPDDDGVQVVL